MYFPPCREPIRDALKALIAMGWTIESTADPMAAGIAAARGGQDAAAAAGTTGHMNFGLQTSLNNVICKKK